MKFTNKSENPLASILAQFPYMEWTELTATKLAEFAQLLESAGFVCENDYEASRCFDLFVESGLVEFEHLDKTKNPQIRKITNGW